MRIVWVIAIYTVYGRKLIDDNMDMTDYIRGKIIILERAIMESQNYINSIESMQHRNLRGQAVKAVKLWAEKLNRFKSNKLNEEDIYYYKELYADKPFNEKTVKQDFSL